MRLYWQKQAPSLLWARVLRFVPMLVLMLAFMFAISTALLFGSPAFAAPLDRQAAISRVKSTYPAKVLNAETIKNNNGRVSYRIKLLFKDGRVKTVIVDGDSGRLFDPNRDN